MSKIIRANITPDCLTWAKKYANIDTDLLSKKVQVSSELLYKWETGEQKPTIKQLLKVAKVCNVPFALFFMDKPPENIPLPVNDLRQLYPITLQKEISYDLTIEIRNAQRIRKFTLEMFSELEMEPPDFTYEFNAGLSDSEIGQSIRDFLGINFLQQKSWKTPANAFNDWRKAFENQNILVIQAAQVDVTTMRGFSLSESQIPVIVVNRKDAYNGRIFTLIHEFIHLATRSSSLCDLSYDNGLEAYCNRLAAQVLMPEKEFLKEVNNNINYVKHPEDHEIRTLSKIFSVSKDSLLRHLYTYQFISKSYFQEKQEEYKREFELIKEKKKDSKGFLVKRSATDVISQQGYYYPSLVINAYFDRKITEHRAVSMLRIKSKHIDDLISKLANNPIGS